MPQSNAQRQARYRQRHVQDLFGSAMRLHMVISTSAKCRLDTLAARRGVTLRSLVETLVADAAPRERIQGR